MKFRFEGVYNIIHFNWHFYAVAFVSFVAIAILAFLVPQLTVILLLAGTLGALVVLGSLLASWYVYDLSSMMRLGWIIPRAGPKADRILNVHAGFDETSGILKEQYPESRLTIYDFFDPVVHTEPSICRARRLYPPSQQTIAVRTGDLPETEDSFDLVCTLLAAHEIRDSNERIVFFKELKRVCKPEGHILVVEHLRDWRNFLAYTIGFLHFHSEKTWLHTFSAAGLKVRNRFRLNAFVVGYMLRTDETAS